MAKFTATPTIEDFLNLLRLNIGNQIVIHYNCPDCDDEQVSEWTEVDDDVITQFETNQCLMVHLDCTNCGEPMKFLHFDFIQGIEVE